MILILILILILQWTYRDSVVSSDARLHVHRLHVTPKKHLKNEQRSKDAAAKKRPNTSGVGKINNYYEDIYTPPYNNTD